MPEDAAPVDDGSVAEPAMREDEMLAMEDGMMGEPAMSEDEMALPEEELLNEAAVAAESADAMLSPEEMMAMEKAMTEAEMSTAREDVSPPAPNDAMGAAPSALVRPLIDAMINTTALVPHPLADLLPRMSASEFADLKESIDIDGLQNGIILFQGKILDGRNRYQACKELGLPITIFGFTGTEQQALTYVLSSNQHRRKLTPSQRSVVARDIMPKVAEDVNGKRIEKLRATLARKAEGECSVRLPNTQSGNDPVIDSRVIAGDMMGVSATYVDRAIRVGREDPALLEEVRAGRVTIPEALRKLDGVTDDPEVIEAKAVQRDLGKALRGTGVTP